MTSNLHHRLVCYCNSLKTYFKHVRKNNLGLCRHFPPLRGIDLTNWTDYEINIEAKIAYGLLKAMNASRKELENLTWNAKETEKDSEAIIAEEEEEIKEITTCEKTTDLVEKEQRPEEEECTTLEDRSVGEIVETLVDTTPQGRLEGEMNSKRKKKLKWTQLVRVTGWK